jgi:inorganic pyrophosphatase
MGKTMTDGDDNDKIKVCIIMLRITTQRQNIKCRILGFNDIMDELVGKQTIETATTC